MKKLVEAIDDEPRMTAVWWLLMLLNLTRKTETCLLEKTEIDGRASAAPTSSFRRSCCASP